MINTLCKSCVFAQWNNGQIGCEQGRLEIFKKKGLAELIEPEKYYKINTLCNRCRTGKWLLTHKKEDVINETQVKVDIILLNNDLDTNKIESNLDIALNHIRKNTIKQQQIIFGTVPLNYVWYYKLLSEKCKMKFQLIRPIDPQTKLGLLDFCARKADGNYYVVAELDQDTEFLSHIVDDLEVSLNDKLERFVMIPPLAELNGLVVQTYAHKKLYGNEGEPLVDKITKLAKEQNKEGLVGSWQKT